MNDRPPEPVTQRWSPYWTVFACLWTLLIWFLSNQAGDIPEPGAPASSNLPFWHADKLVHLFLFTVLSFTWLQSRGVPARFTWVILVACVLLGALDEWNQSNQPGRESSVGDLIFDTIGVGCGLWVQRNFCRKRTRT